MRDEKAELQRFFRYLTDIDIAEEGHSSERVVDSYLRRSENTPRGGSIPSLPGELFLEVFDTNINKRLRISLPSDIRNQLGIDWVTP